MKVLIVDDSLLAEHALKSYFTKLGHEVVGLAKNGEIGIEMFENLDPDIVTVDAVMPGMQGTEFIEYLNKREKENDKRVIIFMISSDEIDDDRRKRIRVDRYLVKPITLRKIRQSLNQLNVS